MTTRITCPKTLFFLSPFIKNIITCVILLIITAHSFLLNGYYSDQRHLTADTYISSILNKIDPSLFEKSIYVQAVNRTKLRIGLLYELIPFFLRFCDFETYALIQTIISLFFVIAGVYTFTKNIFKSTIAGFLAPLLYAKALNSWTLGSPEPYLDFFHHGLPYTYPLSIWSMVFWYRKRYACAMLLAGIAWAFHPMGALFLLVGYGLYWIVNLKEFPLSVIVRCGCAFLLPALPFMIRSFEHIGKSSASGPLWLKGINWVMFFTCMPATWHKIWLIKAACFFVLTAICYFFISDLTIRRWFSIFFLSIAVMCLIGTIFADYLPVASIIKLSLWRSTANYIFLALPCIAFMLTRLYNVSIYSRCVVLLTICMITMYLPDLPLGYMLLAISSIAYLIYTEKNIGTDIPAPKKHLLALLVFIFLCITIFYIEFFKKTVSVTPFIMVMGILLYAFLDYIVMQRSCTAVKTFRRYGLAVLFLIIFDISVLSAQGGPRIYYHGILQGNLDPWAAVQFFSRGYSQRDDLFIVPPYLNGFSMYSYRAIVGDWAEGTTLIYLDNQFVYEWFERMYDLGWTEKHLWYDGYNRLTTPDILRVAHKYGATFVVTEKPKTFNLKKIYENEKFILYRVEA